MLALGLDPIVGAMVRRGWGRGRAALAVFAGLFVAVFAIVLITAGPVWEQIVEFVNEIPAYWDELISKPAFQDIVSTGTSTTRSARRSRTSPPDCRTPPRPSSASPPASSARCSPWSP